jgi:hypothetical protein
MKKRRENLQKVGGYRKSGGSWESSSFPLSGVEPIGLVWLAIQRGELLGRNQNDMNGLDGILFSMENFVCFSVSAFTSLITNVDDRSCCPG